MKKIKLSALLAFSLLAMVACKKKKDTAQDCPTTQTTVTTPNTTPPTITLIGAGSVTLAVGDSFVDDGALAIDFYGDTIPVTVDASNLNTSTTGTYTVNYSATDVDGNTAQVTRTVIVEIQAKNWEGDWNVVHDVKTGGFLPTNLLKPTCNINEFGGLYTFDHEGRILEGTVSGQNVTITGGDITVNFTSTFTLTGTGSINNTGDQIIINYTPVPKVGSCSGCSVPPPGTATYTKQ